MTTETLVINLRRTTPHDSGYAENANAAADLIELQAAEIAARDETIRRLREDEVRLGWLIENATTTGGGHGLTLTVFIPHDSEDIRGAIDGARAALKDAP